MSDLPPNGFSASEARQKISEGWLTSVELTTACLDRLEETESQLNAWAFVDRESALAQAAQLDELRKSGKPTGPLHGIPVGLKDIIDVKDVPGERGSEIFKGRVPHKDAKIVERLREAGAVLIGKTKTTELAFVHPTDTRNPHNPEHTPGGSSSGSAAAVAGYHVPLSVGTQTNGSVIRPASYCGTYGFKPSRGITPRTGILQTSKSLDQVGVFARSLEDVALLAEAISIYDPADELSYARARPAMVSGVAETPPVEPDIAVIDPLFADRVSTDAKDGLDEVISSLGDQVERVTPPSDFADMLETQRIIHEYEICHHLAETFDAHWDQISPTLQPIVERGRAITESQYDQAVTAMGQVEDFFDQFFHDFDAILCPSATGEAPLISSGGTGDPVFSTVWTLAGLPCVSLPLLVGSNGLPIGVQLVGGPEEDARLLRTANWMLTTVS